MGGADLRISLFYDNSQGVAWRVETLNAAVDAEIEALPGDVRARLTHIGRMIAEFGLIRIREPYVKHLDGKMWEMRAGGRGGIARAIYVAAIGQRVVILHAFVKKSQKTPARALGLAIKRAKEAGLI